MMQESDITEAGFIYQSYDDGQWHTYYSNDHTTFQLGLYSTPESEKLPTKTKDTQPTSTDDHRNEETTTTIKKHRKTTSTSSSSEESSTSTSETSETSSSSSEETSSTSSTTETTSTTSSHKASESVVSLPKSTTSSTSRTVKLPSSPSRTSSSSNATPSSNHLSNKNIHSTKVKPGTVAGAVIGSILGAIFVAFLIWFLIRRRNKKKQQQEDAIWEKEVERERERRVNQRKEEKNVNLPISAVNYQPSQPGYPDANGPSPKFNNGGPGAMQMRPKPQQPPYQPDIRPTSGRPIRPFPGQPGGFNDGNSMNGPPPMGINSGVGGRPPGPPNYGRPPNMAGGMGSQNGNGWNGSAMQNRPPPPNSMTNSWSTPSLPRHGVPPPSATNNPMGRPPPPRPGPMSPSMMGPGGMMGQNMAPRRPDGSRNLPGSMGMPMNQGSFPDPSVEENPRIPNLDSGPSPNSGYGQPTPSGNQWAEHKRTLQRKISGDLSPP